jgi:hypothetical protein
VPQPGFTGQSGWHTSGLSLVGRLRAAKCFQPLTECHQVVAQVVHESAPLTACPALPPLFRLSQQAALLIRAPGSSGMPGHCSFGNKKIYGVHFVFPSASALDVKIFISTSIILTHNLFFVNTQIKFFGPKLENFNI